MSDITTKQMIEAKAEALARIDAARDAIDKVIAVARSDRWTIIEHSEAVDARDEMLSAEVRIRGIRDDPKPRDPQLVP